MGTHTHSVNTDIFYCYHGNSGYFHGLSFLWEYIDGVIKEEMVRALPHEWAEGHSRNMMLVKYRWPRKHPFNSDFPVGTVVGSDGEEYLGTSAASRGTEEQGRLSLAGAR